MPGIISRLGLVIALAVSAGTASATERVLLSPVPSSASAKSAGLATAAKETERGAIAKLRARVAKEGKVRVVVGLRVPFAPEAKLSTRERARQSAEIADAAGVLRKKFARTGKRAGDFQLLASVPFAVMTVNRAEIDKLQADPNVLTLVEDQPLAPQLAYSVPLIGAPAAWQAGATGAGQTVAVIDHTTQTDHLFLRDASGKSKVIYEAVCTTVCTPGQGTAAKPGSLSAHGTSVSGIIVGQRAQPPLTGVAPDARLMVFRVYYASELLLAMQKVYELRNQYNIAAVSLSLGMEPNGPGSCDARNPAMTAIINNLREAGTATVVAAGNNSDKSPGGWTGTTDRLMFPACISSAVSVGAIYPSNKSGSKETTKYEYNFSGWICKTFQPIKVDEVACFSNTSPGLSLLAPGFPTETSGLNGSYDAGFGGTSAATPHVAGAFAVLRSKVPNASVSQILQALRATGKPVKDYRTGLTTPRIEIAKALEYLQGNSTAGNLSYTLSYSRTGSGTGTLTASVSGASLACSSDSCSTTQPEGTVITLTAQPTGNSTFTGWSGACAGTAASCTVTLKAAASVVASFQAQTTVSNVTFRYMKMGAGTISATVNGVTTSCSGSCTISRPAGTMVTLTAQPGPDAIFRSWIGSCSGTSPTCTISMQVGGMAVATFQARSPSVASNR